MEFFGVACGNTAAVASCLFSSYPVLKGFPESLKEHPYLLSVSFSSYDFMPVVLSALYQEVMDALNSTLQTPIAQSIGAGIVTVAIIYCTWKILVSWTVSMFDTDDTALIRVSEGELNAEKKKFSAKTLESEDDSLVQEIDNLLHKLADAEKTTEELRSRYSLLTAQYADREKKYDGLTHAPPPPPPPPPPPVARTEGFLPKITGEKKDRIQQKLADGGVDVSKDYSKAIEEMTKRIKQGKVGLKAVQMDNTVGDSVDSAEENSSLKPSVNEL